MPWWCCASATPRASRATAGRRSPGTERSWTCSGVRHEGGEGLAGPLAHSRNFEVCDGLEWRESWTCSGVNPVLGGGGGRATWVMSLLLCLWRIGGWVSRRAGQLRCSWRAFVWGGSKGHHLLPLVLPVKAPVWLCLHAALRQGVTLSTLRQPPIKTSLCLHGVGLTRLPPPPAPPPCAGCGCSSM